MCAWRTSTTPRATRASSAPSTVVTVGRPSSTRAGSTRSRLPHRPGAPAPRRGAAGDPLGRGPPTGRARHDGGVGRDGPVSTCRWWSTVNHWGCSCSSRRGASGSSALLKWSSRARLGEQAARPSGTRGCTGAATVRTCGSRPCSRRAASSPRRSTPAAVLGECAARSRTCSMSAAMRSACCSAAAKRSCPSSPSLSRRRPVMSRRRWSSTIVRRRAVAGLAPVITRDDAGSRLVVPFVSGDAAEGLIDVKAGAGLETGDDEIELLQILASQAAAALANARCTARWSVRPSPTGSPASTTIATSTSVSTRSSPARSATGCRSRCS